MQIPPKPGHIHTLEFVRILTPYVLAHDIVKGKTVLELGCGLGYGVWLLVTGGASRVVALDLDKAKIFHTVGSCPYYRDRVLRVIRIAIPSFVRTWIKNLYHHNISSPKLSFRYSDSCFYTRRLAVLYTM